VEKQSRTLRTQLYLTPADHGRPLTLEEFMRSDSQEGFQYELINGMLYVSPLPELPHDEVRCRLRRLLNRYAEQYPEAIQCVHGPARVFVPERAATTAPEPDVAAYREYPIHLPLARRRWQDVSPVLVVEVLWGNTADKDLERNRALYLEVPSIREYWIVDPRADADRPSLTVLLRRGRNWQRPIEVAAGGRYTTRLLPGFTLDLGSTT
jgi:Uma2 family endonuclease